MNALTLEVMDLYCVAYLHARGVRLVRLAPTDTGRVSFIFVDDSTASRCLGEWRLRRAFIDARAFAESLRLAKRLLMTTLNARRNGTAGELGHESAQPAQTC